MFKAVKSFIRDEEAPTAVEYALMVAGIAVAIAGVVYALGDTIKGMFTSASASIKP